MAVTSIVAPQDTCDHYDTIIPRAMLTNNGDVIPMVNAFMYIGLPYGDTVQIYDGPAPGESAAVSFKPWPAHPTGLVTVRCSIEVEGDTNPDNDFFTDTVQVLPIDVGCRLIVSPIGMLDSGSTTTPVARFKNFGTSPQTFPVWFRIEAPDTAATDLQQGGTTALPRLIYEDSDTIALAPQESTEVSFDDWLASPPDTYSIKAFTALFGDDNQSNDTVRAQLIVGPGPGIEGPGNLYGVPREYSLGSPRPNPFSGRMLVPFGLPTRSRISLRIYDAVGALVRTLTAAETPAGFHHALWDGTDERGLRAKPGTYFCRLEAPTYSRIAKLIMSS